MRRGIYFAKRCLERTCSARARFSGSPVVFAALWRSTTRCSRPCGEQVRELHRRTDEITSSKTRMHDHIRARLSWNDQPSLPSAQRDPADEVVEAPGNARPSTSQSRQLWRACFGR